MTKICEKINIAWGGVVTVLTAVFGQFWFLFAAFLALNVADYITGILKAKLAGKENSVKGAKGIAKKTGYWLLIAIAFFVSYSFGTLGEIIGVNLEMSMLIGWLTLATFIINEIRSILENLVLIGVVVPKFLIHGLEVAAKKIEQAADYEE